MATTANPAVVRYQKVSTASRKFAEISAFDDCFSKRLSIHTNAKDRGRTYESFVDHNTANELVRLAQLSEQCQFFEKIDGEKRELCHLYSLNRSLQENRKKFNNVNNLAVLAKKTNQIIGKRCISRMNAEVLDRMVLSGQIEAAKVFAGAVCY